MREIKFRVWGKDNDGKKRMFDTFDFYDTDCGPIAKDSVLMQYTGYKDKNGKEIYEGDILRCHFDDVMKPVNMMVRWEGVGWEPFNSYSDIFLNGYKPSEHLVIGNIYQNPEIEYEKPVIDTALSEHDQELIKEGHQRSDRDTRRGV